MTRLDGIPQHMDNEKVTSVTSQQLEQKTFKEMKIDFSLLRPRLGFIINNYFLLLSSGFHGQIDKILIAPILGFTVLGIVYITK